ncbi:DNA-protecting protein DprA [Candidatus Falkowbacteria bacterium]|jgi:DNA processing protein|nr:DNA-protecting protein DprA [Candidatus Falkowbacteria bacterium]
MSIVTDKSLPFLVAISKYPKIGPQRFKQLITHFKEAELIWQANLSNLKNAGLSKNIAEDFILKRKQINPEQEIENLKKEQIKVITIESENYPEMLKSINNPPFLLFYKGTLKKLSRSLAIVGTRAMSAYGKQATYNIATELSNNGLTIVSGLALGIDTIAHKSALEANGKTIAVLGSGINKENIYPQANQNLTEQIINSGGAIISEHPPGTEALHFHFPMRNRIVSGLSLGTLVIESKEKGGSLITAEYALEQNRKLFAVPGNIYKQNYVGTNNLIKTGQAKLVTNAENILKELKIEKTPNGSTRKIINPKTEEEKIILKHLNFEPININKLTKLTNLGFSKISSTLTMMELNGWIKNMGNMNYALILDKE